MTEAGVATFAEDFSSLGLPLASFSGSSVFSGLLGGASSGVNKGAGSFFSVTGSSTFSSVAWQMKTSC